MHFKPGYQYMFACKQINNYVHWVNDWRFSIYQVCWSLIIAFLTKNTLEITFILLIFHVCKFWRREIKPQKYIILA